MNSRLGGLGITGTLIAAFAIATILPGAGYTQSTLDVVISEIAWMGTTTSYNDEWIELRKAPGSGGVVSVIGAG